MNHWKFKVEKLVIHVKIDVLSTASGCDPDHMLKQTEHVSPVRCDDWS